MPFLQTRNVKRRAVNRASEVLVLVVRRLNLFVVEVDKPVFAEAFHGLDGFEQSFWHRGRISGIIDKVRSFWPFVAVLLRFIPRAVFEIERNRLVREDEAFKLLSATRHGCRERLWDHKPRRKV